MKGSLGKDRFASQQRLGDPAGNAHRPVVMFVVSIGKGDQETGVRNTFHERENPLRVERSVEPRTLPAKRMKACAPLLALAFSNWSRTRLPRATPLLAAVVSSQAASSLSRRTVIV